MSEWIVLLPVGASIEIVRDSPAVDTPTLVSKEQIMALAEAAATMKLAGIPVEIGDLLRRHIRPDLSNQPELDFEQPRPVQPRPAEYPCSCANIFADELALRRHLTENPSHDLKWIPPEHRVDA